MLQALLLFQGRYASAQKTLERGPTGNLKHVYDDTSGGLAVCIFKIQTEERRKMSRPELNEMSSMWGS